VLAHLIDREDAVADEVGVGAGELGKDETGAIAEDEVVGEVDRLEVLRLAGRGRDRDLFGSDEGVDGARLADVWVADQADGQLGASACGLVGVDR
jgi:hypothetical protein